VTPYAGSLLCRPGRQDAGRVFYCTISELDLLRDSSLAFLEDLPPLFLLGHNLGNRLLANLQISSNLFLRPPLLRLQLEGDLSLHSLQFAFLLRRQVASGHVATNDEGLLLRFEFSLR